MIKGLQPKYGYTDNGNKYRKCTAGKKAGAFIATGGLAVGLVKSAKSPEIKATFKQILDYLPDKATKTKVGAIMVATYALAAASIVGVYTLIGHGVDTIVNKISQNKADKNAEKGIADIPPTYEKIAEENFDKKEIHEPTMPVPTMTCDYDENCMLEPTPLPYPEN